MARICGVIVRTHLTWTAGSYIVEIKTSLPSSGLKEHLDIYHITFISDLFAACQKPQLTSQVCQVHFGCIMVIVLFSLSYFRALEENIKRNSPGDLFAIKFVLFAPFLPASICGCCWSQLLPPKKATPSMSCGSVCVSFELVCTRYVCVFYSASSICDAPHPAAGILWGYSQEITPCSHIFPSSESLLSCPLVPRLPPPLCKWHTYSIRHYMTPKWQPSLKSHFISHSCL